MHRKEVNIMLPSIFKVHLYLIVCTVLLFAADFGESEPFSGAYNFLIKTLEPCPDAHQYRLHYGSRLSKYNRTTVTYSSPINMPYDFDDTWTANVNVAIWGNGGFKENFYNVKFDNLCSTLKSLVPDAMDALAKNLNVDEICPLKAGKYVIKDFIVQFGNFSGLPSFPYGNYKFETIIHKNHENNTKELMGCFRYVVEVSQKRTQ